MTSNKTALLLAVCLVLATVCPVAGGAAPQPNKAIIDIYTYEVYLDPFDVHPVLCADGTLESPYRDLVIRGKPITSDDWGYGFRFETTMDVFDMNEYGCLEVYIWNDEGFGDCKRTIAKEDMMIEAYNGDDGKSHCGDAYYYWDSVYFYIRSK